MNQSESTGSGLNCGFTAGSLKPKARPVVDEFDFRTMRAGKLVDEENTILRQEWLLLGSIAHLSVFDLAYLSWPMAR